jgi:hypothetical protein
MEIPYRFPVEFPSQFSSIMLVVFTLLAFCVALAAAVDTIYVCESANPIYLGAYTEGSSSDGVPTFSNENE